MLWSEIGGDPGQRDKHRRGVCCHRSAHAQARGQPTSAHSSAHGRSQHAFFSCSGLTSLVIPDSVTSIGLVCAAIDPHTRRRAASPQVLTPLRTAARRAHSIHALA